MIFFEEGAKEENNECMFQYAKLLFMGKGVKKSKKLSLDYLNKSTLNGYTKSQDFLVSYQVLFDTKGFRDMNSESQYFFISNVARNSTRGKDLVEEQFQGKINQIFIKPS